MIYRNWRNTRRIISAVTSAAGIAAIFLTGLESAWAFLLMTAAFATSGASAVSGRDEARRMLKKARAAFIDAEDQLDAYISQWNSSASDSKFNSMKSELLKLADQYNELTAKGQKMVRDAEEDIKKYQLQKFLDSFRIYDAKIEKISHTKKATLQSYGIETAADIDPRYLAVIPGFGSKHTKNLMDWRRKIESRFVFNPNKGVDRFQLAEIHKKINEEKSKLENELSKGADQLKHIADETKKIRIDLMEKIETALQEYAKAEANLKCCS
jgi:DNA-binding helix-hairpin-helix protein with protein kinase domain